MNIDHDLDASWSKYLASIKDQGRTMLLPALLTAQKKYGHISKYHAQSIGRQLNVPLAEITGVIEFYSMLTVHASPKPKLGVCTSPVCISQGANNILQHSKALENEVQIESVACLGLCDQAPAAILNDLQIGRATKQNFDDPDLIAPPHIDGDRVLTQHCNFSTKPSIQDYLNRGGFQALKKAFSMSQAEILELVKSSGLKGRGGAGFPTGLKWESAAHSQDTMRYVICNADESEPGTFKDRALLLGDPFSILEGMLIAAVAIKSRQGFWYIRGEYPIAQNIAADVIQQAVEFGVLGEDILGTGFNFNLEVRSGAGAYICGEETALFESIEGKRGFPRIKPPFPTTHGLFGKPTVINNVETFANIPIIFSLGADVYKSMGSESVPGPRLFSVSGDIARPGVYELSSPITLRELLFNLAGGVPNQQELQGVLLGGAAGKFIGPASIDLLLSEEAARQHGLSLGSGAVMVFDKRRDMKEVVASLGHFFAHESCGKCYPCQLGTQRQAEILDRNLNGLLIQGDISRLKDVGWTMTDASLCGLGQTASFAVLSALELWPNLFVEKDLTTYE